jgi:uracil-DNA glycosylase
MPSVGAPLPPGGNRGAGVFLTNALLWLKRGGMQAATPEAWFDKDAAARLRDQIALVRPRVVVGLGQHAYRCVLRAYDLPVPEGRFRTVVEAPEGTSLSGDGPGSRLFGVYHCGARIQNTLRPLEEQHRDWARVAEALGTA